MCSEDVTAVGAVEEVDEAIDAKVNVRVDDGDIVIMVSEDRSEYISQNRFIEGIGVFDRRERCDANVHCGGVSAEREENTRVKERRTRGYFEHVWVANTVAIHWL